METLVISPFVFPNPCHQKFSPLKNEKQKIKNKRLNMFLKKSNWEKKFKCFKMIQNVFKAKDILECLTKIDKQTFYVA